MDLAEVVRRAPHWQRALAALFVSGDPAQEAAAWYDEVAGAFDSPQAQLYREVLAREAGREAADGEPGRCRSRARGRGRPVRADGKLAPGRLPSAGRPAARPRGCQAMIGEIRAMLPVGWLSDTLVGRIAAGSGDASSRPRRGRPSPRAAAPADRTVAFGTGDVLLTVAGALVLAVRRDGSPVGGAPVPAPWLARDGLGLFLRGSAAFLVVASLSGMFVPADTLAEPAAAMLAGVPMLLLTWRCLAAYGMSLTDAFGLRLGSGGASRPPCRHARPRRALRRGRHAHRSRRRGPGAGEPLGARFPEELLWASPRRGRPAPGRHGGLDAVHRGDRVPRRALRHPAAAPADLASRAPHCCCLAAAHGYGAAGFASVFASGVLWTLSYEYTRSLLPGILAHGVNNLMVAVDVLALLRW